MMTAIATHGLEVQSTRDYLLYADQIYNAMMPNNKRDQPFSYEPVGPDADAALSQWFALEREPKQQPVKLCVQAPGMGNFYLFAEPNKRVADLVPAIELKIYELYRAFVDVHKIQNYEGIELPLPCAIGTVLQNHSFIIVQYARTSETFGLVEDTQQQQYVSAAPSSTFVPALPAETPAPARRPSTEAQSYRSGVKFRDAPPTKVIQNKEFSFSVSAKNAPPSQPPSSPPSDDGDYTCDDVWGASVPMPREDATLGDRSEMPYDVIVEEEGGGVLHARDFSVRSSVLDKKRGLYVFFLKIKKNSHYGRTRFIVKVRDRRVRRDSLNGDHNGGLVPDRDASFMRELLASAPIVVVSKERKAAKRKKDSASSSPISSPASSPVPL